ncbi:LysR substrate-binding domain-containing protein, partial [Streptomyces flaveolus]|uniref:LysR substrate-binding domain-containing protein n=1 Tax=Streptomyces flaveolus TaxID=67297 RepID=UPI00343416D9
MGAAERPRLSTARVPEITTEPVARKTLTLVAAPGHPLAGRGRPAAWRDLAAGHFLLLEEGCAPRPARAREA